MRAKGILAGIFGILQNAVGILAIALACTVYFDLFGIRDRLSITMEGFSFHVVAILAFGVFSITSGLFLVHELLQSRFGGV